MPRSAYLDALHLLARRELTESECRARLENRFHSAAQIEAAVAHLRETGAIDDGRVARAHARTAVDVKGRGRLRIARELVARGVSHEVASEALADIFGDLDERTLVARALQKKLRGRQRPTDPREQARLYQYLLRQGFSPAVVTAELRKPGSRASD
jgi:SOS response regulatory protein OraA/RecX